MQKFSKLLVIKILFAFVVDIRCYVTTDCDPSKEVPVYTEVSGKLKISGTVYQKGLENKICEWIIDSSNIKDKHLIHLNIEELILNDRDLLTITTNDSKTILFESNGSLSPGVIIVTEKERVIRVKLVLNDNKLYRKFNILYKTNDPSAQLQNIDSAGSFIFAYTNDSLDLIIDFNLTFKTKLKSKLLLLDIETLNVGIDGFVTFNNISKYNANQPFDANNRPELLLQNGKQINIKIKDFKTKNNSKGIQIYYQLFDSICSQYVLIEEVDQTVMSGIKLPNETDLQTLSSFKCLNVFEHHNENTKLLLDLSGYQFLNIEDLITVRDGISHNSRTLALIGSQFFDRHWNQLYLYSLSNKMWILIDSPQVVHKNSSLNSIEIRSQSQGGIYYFDSNTMETELVVNTNTKPQIPLIYLFEVDLGNQIVIDFNDKPLPGNGTQILMNIYDNNLKTGRPFISLQSNLIPPDILTSNTNQMKIEFKQIVNIRAKIYKMKRGCHSSAVGTTTSYSLSDCNNLCSWLIPKRDNTNGIFVIHFSHLNLLKDSDSINIERLGEKTSTVLNIRGPLSTMIFPDLILDSNDSYVLYTIRKCDKESIDSSQLLGVSLIYIDHNININSIELDIMETKVIKSHNYPNYYSVGSDHLWKISGLIMNKSLKALITFSDLDLSESHPIFIRSINYSQTLTNINQLSQLSDYLVSLPLFLNLNSHTIDGIKPPFSGRGFRAVVTAVNCGEDIKVEPNKPINISTPQSLDGISKCIWTLSTDNTTKSVMNLLEFTLIKGKDFNDNNLKIYDSNSIRDNKVVNLNYFNETKSSSTNSLIIEYIIDSKKPVDLTIVFYQTVCQRMCETTNRCLLPQFLCNYINDCGDYSDERCDGTEPMPAPNLPQLPIIVTDCKIDISNIFLVVFPLYIGLLVLSIIYCVVLPKQIKGRIYHELHDNNSNKF